MTPHSACEVVAPSVASETGDWLSKDELMKLTPEILATRTNALKPLLASHSREAEQIRRPVDTVWSAIRRSGVFYYFVPKRYGGLEFDIDTFIDVALPLAEGCASTAWATIFCTKHNWIVAQFPKEAQDEIFARSPYVNAPSVITPPAMVTRVSGGFRLNGRLKWGSGVMHADWVLVMGLLTESGPPTALIFALPVSDVKVIDVWHVDGMAGTGSNDILVDNVFVPTHRAFEAAKMAEGNTPGAQLHDNPMYRMPMLAFAAVAAATTALGNARAAVALFRDRLRERVVFGTELKHAEKPAAQMRLATADLQTRNAELLIRDAARRVMALPRLGRPSTVEERISVRAQTAYAVDLCRVAVNTVAAASGASTHFLDNPIQRALRDGNVMACHMGFELDGVTELHGRSLIGVPPNSKID
jgi:3-hydroxy-9,10-secoandrosta-1,3,5(10)-triene-9,17-dione monooxygenase